MTILWHVNDRTHLPAAPGRFKKARTRGADSLVPGFCEETRRARGRRRPCPSVESFQPAAARPRFGLALATCALAGFLAQSVAAADTQPAIDPRADEMLKRMGEYLGQAKFFSVSAEIWQDIQLSSGQRIQAGRSLKLQVRRPNRLRVEVHSPRRNRELLYDGKAITLFNRVQNLYGTAPTSGSLDEAMDLACERFGITMPLEDFIRSDPHKDFLEKVTSGSDIGTVDVMGVPCEHLAFTQTNIDWQVWIENGPTAVPRKFVITYKDEPDSPNTRPSSRIGISLPCCPTLCSSSSRPRALPRSR